MAANWGECYFDHFERYLGPMANVSRHEQADDLPAIQVLEFNNVFDGCRTFASLGFSHYKDEVKQLCEVVVPVDDAWDSVADVFVHALFKLIQHQVPIGRGTTVCGIGQAFPDFARAYKKHAMYFTAPFGFPDEFESVSCDGKSSTVYLGFFIWQFEHEFVLREGYEAFESLLEYSEVDPFKISRESAV